MEWIKAKWPYLASAIALLWNPLWFLFARLGDVDTACSVAHQNPELCGAGPVSAVLLDPPAWLMAISFAVGLILFAYGERKREREYVSILGESRRKADDAQGQSAHTADEMTKVKRQMDALLLRHEQDLREITDRAKGMLQGYINNVVSERTKELQDQNARIEKEWRDWEANAWNIHGPVFEKTAQIQQFHEELLRRITDLENAGKN